MVAHKTRIIDGVLERAALGSLADVVRALELGNTRIGPVRSEKLVFSDPESAQSLRDVFLESPDRVSSSYATLKVRQQNHVELIFEALQKNRSVSEDEAPCSVCIRLLDAPVKEILKHDIPHMSIVTRLALNASERGVQLGLSKPTLYINQLEAIFAAYKTYKNKYADKAGIGLEIMVPTVETLRELLAVKKMAEDAAKLHGFEKVDYKFGMLLETAEASKHIGELEKEADFIDRISDSLPRVDLGDSLSLNDTGRTNSPKDERGLKSGISSKEPPVADLSAAEVKSAGESMP
ncbi:MAG: putative PEP-binding protein [Bdellovibrionales bacterium]